jgi:ABC-2 type transport system ATP-binding protein
MLKFTDVKKNYGSHTVLDIPSLEIGGGLYWLKGSNGSGKSTFLKIATGIVPFTGEVEIDGVKLKQQPVDFRRLVSYAEAEPLYPNYLTGFDLVRFFLRVRKRDSAEADQLITKFGIGDFYKNNIGTYSSGMVKKLSLVLAFIGEPKYIFLDEPLVTIDQQTIPVIQDLIDERCRNEVNFIFTSHQTMDPGHLRAAVELEASNKTVRFV